MNDLHALWKERYRLLVFYASSMVHATDAAEDIVSEAFLKLWRTGEWEHEQGVTFLYVCVKNACIDYVRHRQTGYRILDSLEPETVTQEVDDTDYNYLYAHYINRLLEMVEQLPEAERLVIMRLANGQSTIEIAADLGVSPQTVRNQKTRAIGKLKVLAKIFSVKANI